MERTALLAVYIKVQVSDAYGRPEEICQHASMRAGA